MKNLLDSGHMLGSGSIKTALKLTRMKRISLIILNYVSWHENIVSDVVLERFCFCRY